MVTVVVVVVVVEVGYKMVAVGGSSSLIKFTDINHETDNETHTQAPRIYTLMYPHALNHHSSGYSGSGGNSTSSSSGSSNSINSRGSTKYCNISQ